MNKHAFTLAEVLITLGIIGIVAAMTLPTLINRTRQKELETAFKKQYTLLQQATLNLKRKNDLPLNKEGYPNGGNLTKELAKEYKVIKDCGSISQGTGCVLLNEDNSFTYYKTLNGNTLNRDYFDDGGFILNDGTSFFLEAGGQYASIGLLVSIDLNGYEKGPNRMGYDFFMFQVTKDGKVLPMGAENTYWHENLEAFCSKTSTQNRNGYTCAYYAATDKDYFKNLH